MAKNPLRNYLTKEKFVAWLNEIPDTRIFDESYFGSGSLYEFISQYFSDVRIDLGAVSYTTKTKDGTVKERFHSQELPKWAMVYSIRCYYSFGKSVTAKQLKFYFLDVDVENFSDEEVHELPENVLNILIQRYLYKSKDKIIYGYASDKPSDLWLSFSIIDYLKGQGYWCSIKSPFDPYSEKPCKNWNVGFTPHSCTGWNGRADYRSRGETLAIAICRAALIWLKNKNEKKVEDLI